MTDTILTPGSFFLRYRPPPPPYQSPSSSFPSFMSPQADQLTQSKKKRVDNAAAPAPLPDDAGQKPLQLQRRRVWRACESCRRKKIKCDGAEPTCSQCASSRTQCTWLQTKDRAALSRHYVQELETRLLHMENVITQIAPVIGDLGLNIPGLNLPVATPALPPPATTAASATAAPQSSYTQSHNTNHHHANHTPQSPTGLGPSTSQHQPFAQHHPLSPSTSTSSDYASTIKVEDDVSESLGQLALDEHGHMRWIGGSSTMSLIQSFKAFTSGTPLHRISPSEDDPMMPGPSVNKLYFPAAVFFGKVRALPGPEEVEWPDRDLADKLVEAYFERFHFLMPVINKSAFLDQYRQVMDNVNDLDRVRKEAAFISLVFAVFACAARLVDDPRLTAGQNPDEGGMGMVYYERALMLQYISHASIQVAHVQCFILMSSFLCSVNCLPQAWILIGQAVRTGQDLGLHRSPRRLPMSAMDCETRRRIWWGVYTLDRMLALSLGRPLGVEDTDCDVELPAQVDDENLPAYFSGSPMPSAATINTNNPTASSSSSSEPVPLMAGFISLITLYQIGGRVLRQVYSIDNCKDNLEPERRTELQHIVDALDRDLTHWCEALPAVFKSAPQSERHVSLGAVLCSHYYSLLTTLHRNFLPVRREASSSPNAVPLSLAGSPGGSTPAAARKSTQKAVTSARSCIRLAPSIRNVVPPSHHLSFFIQHLFSAAVIVLLYAMHSAEPSAAAQAMEEGKSCLTALDSWVGYWPGAFKCKELLTDLTNTANEAIGKAQQEAQVRQQQQAQQQGTTGVQRRHSVSIVTPGATGSSSGTIRAMKGRTGVVRRAKSRDPSASTRRPPVVSPYPSLSQRNRSSSRKRGHDESEESYSSSYRGIFHSPAMSSTTSHSSPQSVSLGSPTLDNMQQQPTSPTMGSPRQNNNANGDNNNNGSNLRPLSIGSNLNFGPSPLSPLHPSSPPRYDYDFGSMSSHQQQSSQWSNNHDSSHNGRRNGYSDHNNNSSNNNNNNTNTLSSYTHVDYMNSSTGNGSGGGSSSYLDDPHSFDENAFGGFDGSGSFITPLASTTMMAGGAPAYFPASGLPFRGLEFIRNFDGSSNGSTMGGSGSSSGMNNNNNNSSSSSNGGSGSGLAGHGASSWDLAGEHEPLWQSSFDMGAFGYEPELSFPVLGLGGNDAGDDVIVEEHGQH